MSKKERDLAWLIDIFRTLGTVAGSLTSLAILFVAMGYVIVLSFIQELKLYGLANFPREFFMEADLQLLGDLCNFFGRDFILGPCVFIFSLVTSLWLVIYSQRKSVLKWVFLGLLFVIVSVTFKLAVFSGKGEIQRSILYSVSVPFLFALIVYLVMNIGQLTRPGEWVRNAYLVFFMLLLLLFLLIPVSYGRYLYDLDVYSINAFEFNSKYDNDSMRRMRESISKDSGGEIYFIMGHTAGKEIFFIATSTPKKMIIIDREAVSFLGVVSEPGKAQTLRGILAPPASPVLTKETKEASKKEQEELKALFEKLQEEKK